MFTLSRFKRDSSGYLDKHMFKRCNMTMQIVMFDYKKKQGSFQGYEEITVCCVALAARYHVRVDAAYERI